MSLNKNILRFFFVCTLISTTTFNSFCQTNGSKCLDSLLKRRIICKRKCVNDTSIEFDDVRDAAYGVKYSIPKNFKEEIRPSDKIYAYDTITYFSLDKICKVMVWPGKTIPFPIGQINKDGKPVGIKCEDIIRVEKIARNYLTRLKHGKVKGIVSNKSTDFCLGISGFYFDISFNGITKKFGYIYKIQISEVPVSGDLIFKNFMFKYDLKEKDKYENIGNMMANDFGN